MPWEQDDYGEWVEVEAAPAKPALWVKKSETPVAKEKVAKETPVVAKEVAKEKSKSFNPQWNSEKAKEYGRLGGLARKAKLSPERRKEISLAGVKMRWPK